MSVNACYMSSQVGALPFFWKVNVVSRGAPHWCGLQAIDDSRWEKDEQLFSMFLDRKVSPACSIELSHWTDLPRGPRLTCLAPPENLC